MASDRQSSLGSFGVWLKGKTTHRPKAVETCGFFGGEDVEDLLEAGRLKSLLLLESLEKKHGKNGSKEFDLTAVTKNPRDCCAPFSRGPSHRSQFS